MAGGRPRMIRKTVVLKRAARQRGAAR
jgi:hypothetical protein